MTNRKLRFYALAVALIWFTLSSSRSIAQEMSDVVAPSEVQSTMPPNAVSILFGKYPIGPDHQDVLVHVYAIPKSPKPRDSQSPYTRDDFLKLDVPKCQYVTDLLVRDNGKLKRINQVMFKNTDGVNGIVVKWLEPKARRGPVIAIHTGYTHWLGWQ